MLKKIRDKTRIIHMAGIVPVACPPLDFGMPWSDCLMPVGQNYVAIERAVYECALAGCETIWVVAHYNAEPIIRTRLGDYIADPVSLTTGLNPSLKRKDISILYCPIRPGDKVTKDSIAWSILYGADTAFRVSAFLSKWIIPEKFYCAFPYGISEEKTIWKNRMKISSTEKTVFRHNNKTVKDGLQISFTFDEQDYKIAKRRFSKNHEDEWDFRDHNKQIRHSLQEIFKNLSFEEHEVIDLPWHYDISSWERYKAFLSSEESNLLVKNKGSFLKKKRKLFGSADEMKTFKIIDNDSVEDISQDNGRGSE